MFGEKTINPNKKWLRLGLLKMKFKYGHSKVHSY
jgi:hypothetical protein